MKELIKLPKVELHLHLDGSVRISTVCELLNITNLEAQNKMIVDNNVKSLTDYLSKFDLPLKVLQTKDNIKRVVKELLEDLKKENVIYAEIRFAPMLHVNLGLTYEEIVESVVEAKNEVNDIKCNFILCCMRYDILNNNINNLKTIEVAEKYYKKGVVALDLAGDEKKFPTKDFKELFKNTNIPLTIHAGEADSYKSIEDALLIGASRIGHGIEIINNKDLMEEVNKNKIALEICPQSNIDTCAISDKKNHPITKLINKVLVTINTDNRTVSNITLTKEYEDLINLCNFSIEDIKKCNINAIKSAFISDKEKQELLDIIQKEYN